VDLQEKGDNFVGALAYGLGWLSAIYFINVPRRAIRWHAYQSIVVFGGLMLSLIVADGILPAATGGFSYQLRLLVMGGLLVISWALWFLLPFQTFRGRPFLVPVFAPLTLKLAGPPPWTLPPEPWQPMAAGGAGGSGQNAAWSGSGSSAPPPCGACGGSGRSNCPTCGGSGRQGFGSDQHQCGYCIGSGRVQCMSCGGTGRGQALI
jgi:uncharacterized membrane protein